MSLPIEIVIEIYKYLPSPDRMAASETCKLWYNAANHSYFIKNKCVALHKIILDDEKSPLKVFENSSIVYPNFLFQDVEVTPKLNNFWNDMGEGIRSLTLKHCDMCEKTFVNILKCCPNLEELTVQSCRELFMSGRLMEGQVKGLAANSLICLKKLSLADNKYLSDALFNRFIATAPNLSELGLSSCSVSFHAGLYKKFYPEGNIVTPSESVLTFHFVLQFLIERAKVIKKLSFSQTLIDGVSLKTISEIPGLTLDSLQLHCCDQLTNSGIRALTSHQTSLRELDLAFCSRVTDASLVLMCNTLINLQILNMQSCRAISDHGIIELPKLKKLTSLNIANLEHVSGRGIELGICSEVNYVLRDLVVNTLNIDDTTINAIAEKLPNLRMLDISYCINAVTDETVQNIFKNQIYLEYLLLSHCEKVSDVGLTGLGTIDDDQLEEVPEPATDEPVYRICLGSRAEGEIVRDAERKRTVLKMCENMSSEFTGYSITRLKNLKELDLSCCNRITDVSLIYAFKFVQLANLNLSRCQQITSEGVQHLVKNCPSLQVLNLIDCFNLTDEAAKVIVQGLYRLKHLQLKGCNQLTDETVEAVKNYCRKIQILDLQACRKITPEAAASLGCVQTLHTLFISKPGPYIADAGKKTPQALPYLRRLLKLN